MCAACVFVASVYTCMRGFVCMSTRIYFTVYLCMIFPFTFFCIREAAKRNLISSKGSKCKVCDVTDTGRRTSNVNLSCFHEPLNHTE